MVKPLLQWGINGYKVNFERVREILQVDADDKNAVYIEGPFNITRSRKIAKTWWGERWMEFFESDGQSDTLAKGRKLARSGGVLGIKIQPGKASAVVVEDYYHRTEKCRPSIDLPVLTDNEWERVLDEMGSGVRYQAEMLGGQLPESIQDVFENAYVPLFVVPASQGTCIFAWRSMCLHAAALCYVLTELIDNDPFLLFLLRGRGRESLMQAWIYPRFGSAASPKSRIRISLRCCRASAFSQRANPSWKSCATSTMKPTNKRPSCKNSWHRPMNIPSNRFSSEKRPLNIFPLIWWIRPETLAIGRISFVSSA